MKKLFVVIGTAFILLGCSTESVVEPQQSPGSPSANRKAADEENQELQTLIRKWNEWAFTKDFSVAPFNDPTGDFQYLAQPYASGVFMLATGISPETVDRTVTISLSQYQYVFIGLVGTTGWFNPCDPEFGPHGGQSFEVFLSSIIKQSFNGPSELTLDWDGVSLLSKKQKDLRANSGVWSFAVHPFYTIPCAEAPSVYADGFWAKVPLSLGTHTLTVGGQIDGKQKLTFSSLINYTLIVTE